MPGQLCPGCTSRDATISAFVGKNDVLERRLGEQTAKHHKLEADYAEQTSRLSYDLDQSRQATATMHTGKAADAEKAAMFKRMKSLEVEMESMPRKVMKVLSENTELHNAELLRRAMPEASHPPTGNGRAQGKHQPI